MRDILPRWSNLVFTQLISYGVQLGHSINNSLDFCAWMIRGKRQNIFLIDLFKFNYMLRAGLYVLEAAVRGRKPVWFVNLDKISSLFVKFPALECGEYWVTENWIKGMISNYFVIKKSFLKNVNRHFAVWNRKFFLKNSNFSHWGFTRYTWPRFIFVSNALKSYGPCHEAHRLGIPALGVVDTNTPHNLVSIALPGNDESASALVFYNSFISTFILYIKYSFVQSWYMSCLDGAKFSFNSWWQQSILARLGKRKISPNVLSFNFDQLRYMVGGFESQFLQGSWQTRKLENLKYNYLKKRSAISLVSIKAFYSKKIKLLKALAKTWTLSSFFLKFLKPGLRKTLTSKINRKFQSKYSLTKYKNMYYFLMPFRLSERFFFKKVSRRLARIKIALKAKRFFYKFYSLAALFAFFRHNYVFTKRLAKKIDFQYFFHRGGVRFPNYRSKDFLAPSSYRRIFPRAKYRKFYARKQVSASFAKPASSLPRSLLSLATRGRNKMFPQFSWRWIKSLFLLRYCSSLGMPLTKLTHLNSGLNSSLPFRDFLLVNSDFKKDLHGHVQPYSPVATSMPKARPTQYSYKKWKFNIGSSFYKKASWFLRGKLRFSHPLRKILFNPYIYTQRVYIKKLLGCNSIAPFRKKRKQILWGGYRKIYLNRYYTYV